MLILGEDKDNEDDYLKPMEVQGEDDYESTDSGQESAARETITNDIHNEEMVIKSLHNQYGYFSSSSLT